MGKIKIILLFLSIIINTFALEFGVETVYGKFTPPNEMNTTIVQYVGVRNNFYITPNFALNMKYDLTKSIKGKNLHRYGVGLRYQVTDLDEDFQPFFDISTGNEKGISTNKFLQYTLGAKYYLTTGFNLLGEANYIKIKEKSQSYSFGLGLGYNFCRKPIISKYSDKPIDENVMKSLAKQKLDIKEDIFLTPY